MGGLQTPEGLARGGLQVHTGGGRLRGLAGGGVWGGIPACTEADTPPADGYCCGRYASYWNAFLLQFKNIHLIISSIVLLK